MSISTTAGCGKCERCWAATRRIGSFRVECARWMGTGCCHGENSLRLFEALASLRFSYALFFLSAPLTWCGLDRFPQLRRRVRHIDMVDAQGCRRIHHRVGDRGGAPLQPASPTPLTPSGWKGFGVTVSPRSSGGISLALALGKPGLEPLPAVPDHHQP